MYATQLHDGNNNDSNNNNNGHRSQFLPTTPLYNFQQSPSYKANWFTFLIVHGYVCMYVCMRKTELTYTHVEYNNVKNKFTLGDAATWRPVSLWNYVLLKRNFLPRIEFCKKKIIKIKWSFHYSISLNTNAFKTGQNVLKQKG